MNVKYVDLVDYIAIAAEATGLEVDTLFHVAKLDLADSALHAPAAGLGEVEFYPDFVDKAAVGEMTWSRSRMVTRQQQTRPTIVACAAHPHQALTCGAQYLA